MRHDQRMHCDFLCFSFAGQSVKPLLTALIIWCRGLFLPAWELI